MSFLTIEKFRKPSNPPRGGMVNMARKILGVFIRHNQRSLYSGMRFNSRHNLIGGDSKMNRKKYSISRMLWFIILLVVPFAIIAAWLAFGFTTAQTSQAAAGINKQINYQGRIADSNGISLATGNYNFKFQIYDDPSGGNLLWTERWTATTTAGVVRVINGAFSAPLGTSTALSTIDFNSDLLYLKVSFDANSDGIFEEVFSPRKKLTSSPYAFNADMVDGIHATSTATANQLLALDSNLGLSLSNITTTNKLLVGTGSVNWAAPTSTLTVVGSAHFTGVATSSEGLWVGAGGVANNLDLAGGDLYVAGDAEFDGRVYFSKSPTTAHSFTSWATGAANTNSSNATLYVNPASAVSDSNLLALDVNSLTKFLVDAEGDTFAKSLTLEGSLSVGTSNISTLIVENNSFLGDAPNSDWTNINGTAWIYANKNLSVASSTALMITQTGTGNYLEVNNGASYYGGTRYFTITNDGTASTTKFVVQGNATTTGNLVVGVSNWATPTSTLSVVGSAHFTGVATSS
ncbi:MAG: hypothetical protein WC610_03215, partial [Patescibacteria group bacterium]